MTIKERLITKAEFARIEALPENSERRLELVDGEIHEKMGTEGHGSIIIGLGARLWIFQRETGLGGRFTSDASHEDPDDDYNDRRPDISYIAASSDDPRPAVMVGAIQRYPDLAVEVQSPDDTYAKMRRKAAFYLRKGVQLVWLLFPGKRFVEVYHADGEQEVLFAEDTLTGGDLLPGFSVSVADLFNV